MRSLKVKSQAICFAIVMIVSTAGNNFAQNVIKILPLGNSITVGYTDGVLPVSQQISYRFGLYYQLTSAGYTFDFVGSEQSGCAFFSDCQHGGINGFRDQYLVRLLTDGYDEKRLKQLTAGPYLDAFNPDIILLHLGTNDVTHETNPGTAQMEAVLNLIDAYEARAGKEVTVFLALIINRMTGYPLRTETSNYNNQLKAMAQARINNGDKIVILDMEHDAGFLYNSTDMTDYLHPNTTGYNKMAGLWYQYITSYFNQAPVITPIPDQVVPEGENFAMINLNDYVSDQEDADQYITWTITPVDPENFDIVFSADKQVTITPNDENWNGSETIIFKAFDRGVNGGFIKYDTDTVVFTVTPVEDAPVFTSTPFVKAKEDSLYYYVVSATDAENQPVTYAAKTIPAWLAFNPATRILTGTPGNDNLGDNQVVLSASDGGLSTDQSFTITVINVNNSPVIVGMTRTVKTVKNIPVELKLSDLLVQDPDNVYPDDFILTLEGGDNYTISGNTVIPENDFTGTLKVQARVNDGSAYSPYSNINVLVDFSSGVDDQEVEDNIYVYPNPSSGIFWLRVRADQDVSLSIHNSLGSAVFSRIYRSQYADIEVDLRSYGLPTGIYFYKISSDGKNYSGKITIQ